ncbi:MAG TPA: polygranule-associated protein [Janthinobacterium sp.]|nr:polygranule-associated protein [Janthinobacterium sp.]
MVKKLKALAKDEEKQLASAVRTSAQQIWQAGLGAFAKAQEEGGRVFSKLVKEGTELQKRAEDKVSDVTGTVTKMADGVSKQASGSWDKLEQVFEDRVSRALGKIGVPTQKEILALTKRVEQLSKAVAELSGKKVPAETKPAAAAKPAAKAAVAPKTPKAAVKAAAPKTVAKAAPKASVNFPTAASIKKPTPKAAAVKKPAVKKAAVNGAPAVEPVTPSV